MSNRCAICDKKTQAGRSSRHHRGVAGKQWLKRAQVTKRTFKPNLQWTNVDGIRLRVCAKCLKLIRKGQEEMVVKENKRASPVGSV